MANDLGQIIAATAAQTGNAVANALVKAENAKEEKQGKDWENLEFWSSIKKFKPFYELIYGGAKEEAGITDDMFNAATKHINDVDREYFYADARGNFRGASDVLALGPIQFLHFLEKIFIGKGGKYYTEKYAKYVHDILEREDAYTKKYRSVPDPREELMGYVKALADISRVRKELEEKGDPQLNAYFDEFADELVHDIVEDANEIGYDIQLPQAGQAVPSQAYAATNVVPAAAALGAGP